jgi:1,2-diacylglycerol 3-alpha-glucosyltransferase/glucuronosyltransferase
VRLLIATDAWRPQINGVVRTLGATIDAVRRQGIEVRVVSPELFRTVPLPFYPEIPLAVATPRAIGRRLSDFRPDVVHVVTEGPLGWLARRWCIVNGVRFASSYTTRFPEYVSARVPIPAEWTYRVLRHFHRAAGVTLVATSRLADELRVRGFSNLALWPRGVDTDLFRPALARCLEFPRPIFLTASRLAVEKNIEAFLALDLPGSKVVIGSGPCDAALRRRYPGVHFLGRLHGEELVRAMASADVFVFPSRTDTFGVVQLEALACGVPVAAYPVPGPMDAIGNHPVGCLNDDLRVACMTALAIDRGRCRAYALTRSWQKSAEEYVRQLEVLFDWNRSHRQAA